MTHCPMWIHLRSSTLYTHKTAWPAKQMLGNLILSGASSPTRSMRLVPFDQINESWRRNTQASMPDLEDF
jgi:hypothetical protein